MSTPDAEMTARPWTRRAVATAVAMHLGFVDAFGFVVLGGFFVSSIDATTTRAGVALGGSSWFVVGLAGAILAGFVVGVVLAAVVGRMWPRQRVPRVLLLAAGLLAAAGALHAVTTTAPLIGFTLALAMGAEATLLETGGLLAAAARGLTDRLFGRGPRRWARYLRLWGAAVVGAAAGAVTYRVLGFGALWVAAGAATIAAYAFRNSPTDPADAAGPYGLER
ncbi:MULTISPECIES: DUF1275 family protein [unclassified Rhodococcus (in: high G+C Gram-positive bacteria)]|uniref:DUF1275 family protein n=1 Tax=unclassified Rhodococcus (in: high G+C Gram-positive bacteria) TaxID=192944 RepID=UPI001ED92F7A|nr:DUF1275 family protein [Rhodococcus sp. DK17]